jgi:hypothetical protein
VPGARGIARADERPGERRVLDVAVHEHVLSGRDGGPDAYDELRVSIETFHPHGYTVRRRDVPAVGGAAAC